MRYEEKTFMGFIEFADTDSDICDAAISFLGGWKDAVEKLNSNDFPPPHLEYFFRLNRKPILKVLHADVKRIGCGLIETIQESDKLKGYTIRQIEEVLYWEDCVIEVEEYVGKMAMDLVREALQEYIEY